MEDKMLVLDIETVGGFTPSSGFIVEVGIVELDIKTGEIKTVFDSLCKHPDMRAKHQKSWIFENSDMKVEDVRNAPFLSEIQKEVQSIIDKYTLGITSFNTGFDFPYMEHFGFTFHKIQPDPMKVLAPIMKLPYKTGRGAGKNPKVIEAMSYLFPDEEYEEAHRGASDAKDEARIVYELIKRGFYIIE